MGYYEAVSSSAPMLWWRMTEQINDFTPPSAVGADSRYWRVYPLTSAGNTSYSIAEMEFATASGGPNILTPTSTIAASTVFSTGMEANKAIDGLSGTFWASTNVSPPQWISVDFGAGVSCTIKQVTLKARADAPYFNQCPTTFYVQYSSDNINWSTFFQASASLVWAASMTQTVKYASTNTFLERPALQYHSGNTFSGIQRACSWSFDGVAEFDYYTQGEQNWDGLWFTLDGAGPVSSTLIAVTAGQTGTYSFNVPSGSHTVGIGFRKDPTIDVGLDTGRLYRFRAKVTGTSFVSESFTGITDAGVLPTPWATLTATVSSSGVNMGPWLSVLTVQAQVTAVLDYGYSSGTNGQFYGTFTTSSDANFKIVSGAENVSNVAYNPSVPLSSAFYCNKAAYNYAIVSQQTQKFNFFWPFDPANTATLGTSGGPSSGSNGYTVEWWYRNPHLANNSASTLWSWGGFDAYTENVAFVMYSGDRPSASNCALSIYFISGNNTAYNSYHVDGMSPWGVPYGLNDNKWHHMALTVMYPPFPSRPVSVLYIDGFSHVPTNNLVNWPTQMGTGTLYFNRNYVNGCRVAVGTSNNTTNGWYTPNAFYLAEFAVYPRVLPSEEIIGHFMTTRQMITSGTLFSTEPLYTVSLPMRDNIVPTSSSTGGRDARGSKTNSGMN
jgi:hypothetical protein